MRVIEKMFASLAYPTIIWFRPIFLQTLEWPKIMKDLSGLMDDQNG